MITYAHKLHGRAEADQELMIVLERLKDKKAVIQEYYQGYEEPTKGLEVATSGLIIGALSSMKNQSEVIDYLREHALITPQETSVYQRFLSDVMEGRRQLSADSVQYSTHLHNLLYNPQNEFNVYLQDKTPGGLRLLALTTALGASTDPAFRNSKVVDEIGEFVIVN